MDDDMVDEKSHMSCLCVSVGCSGVMYVLCDVAL